MREIKNKIPQWVKFPLWWVFKSPQRKLGFQTLLRDVKGIFIYVLAYIPFPKKLEAVSICVGILNREEIFLKHFVQSLTQIAHSDLLELSLFDCGSNQALELEKRIKSVFKGKLIFTSESHPFSRSYAVNRSVQQATHPIVFICDADFSLPQDLVQKCNGFTRFNCFWFPIVFYLYKNKAEFYAPENGEWMQWGGKGILACHKRAFLELGGLDESYTEWGGEDEDFWINCHRKGKTIIRSRERELLHHWHPSLNPKYKKLEELSDLGLL